MHVLKCLKCPQVGKPHKLRDNIRGNPSTCGVTQQQKMGVDLSTSRASPEPSNPEYPTFTYKEREYHYIGDHEEELEEFKCAICLGVVFEPTQTSCGHLFCAQCIEKVPNECPTCRNNDLTTTPDNGFLTRKIDSLCVLCPNQNRGCVWTGTLGESIHHLGNECGYEEVECRLCVYRGERREVAHLHPTFCKAFPLRCPNEPRCGAMVTRSTLEEHLEECPEQLLECTFAYAGCTVIVNRRKFAEHLRTQRDEHDRLSKERIEQLSAVILDAVGNGSLQIGKDIFICYKPWLHNPCLKQQPTPPYIFKIVHQSTSVSGKFEAQSDPFYSHAGGYKLYLHVVVSLGSYNFIEAGIHLLKGENDDNLMFPFKGTLTLTLMNQRADRDHLEETLQIDPALCTRENYGTLDDSENMSNSISHCIWEESSSSIPSYLLCGCLYVKVSPVDFDYDYMSTHL